MFAYADADGGLPRGVALLECIDVCYAEFQRLLGKAHETWTCRCEACLRIDQLDLKFVVHAGPYVIQSIAGAAELVGPEVVMAHRLLKNDAATVLGTGAYALLTASAIARFDVPTAGATPMPATYEHYDPIDTFLFTLPRSGG